MEVYRYTDSQRVHRWGTLPYTIFISIVFLTIDYRAGEITKFHGGKLVLLFLILIINFLCIWEWRYPHYIEQDGEKLKGIRLIGGHQEYIFNDIKRMWLRGFFGCSLGLNIQFKDGVKWKLDRDLTNIKELYEEIKKRGIKLDKDKAFLWEGKFKK